MKICRDVLFILLLIPTIGTFIQPFCSPLYASYLYIFTLLVVPLCILNSLVLIYMIYIQSLWKWIFALTTFLTLGLVSTSYSFSRSSDSQENDGTIRLVSWNVDNFLLNRDTLFRSAQFINDLNPGIVCLQERPHDNLLQWNTIQTAFSYPYFIKNEREDEGLNLAVFSKWPLENLREFYFPDTYNKFLLVDVHHPKGVFRLFNIHLQTTGINDTKGRSLLKVLRKNAEYRYEQTDVLAKLIEESPYPVIACGDFNDTPLSYAYKKVSTKLHDSFVEAGNAWGATFQPFNLFRIDYLFSSNFFKIRKYQLFTNCWSDHKIQFGNLSFPPSH